MSMNAIDIVNLTEVEEDVFSSGQPTAEQLRRAREAGLASVINLCPGGECGWDEKAAAEAVGLSYASIPVGAACDVTEQAARALHAALEACPKPALVHCGSGNRVGALFALKAHCVEGCSPEAALDRGRQAGLAGLEATVREKLRAS